MSLRHVLIVDAITCLGTGLLLALFAASLDLLLGLPVPLIRSAGLILLPVAAFMLWLTRRTPVPPTGLWMVVVGNALWLVGSVVVMIRYPLTTAGYLFVFAQAAVVALLTVLEWSHTGPSVRSSAAFNDLE